MRSNKPASPSARSASALPRIGRTVTGAGVAMSLLLGQSAAVGQVGGALFGGSGGGTDRAIPYGSPLDPQGQPIAPAGQGASAVGTQSSTQVEPVEVIDRRNDSQNLDDQDSNDAGDQGTQRGVRAQGRTVSTTAREQQTRTAPPPSEFERYVERAAGRRLPRFGADLLVPGSRDFALPATATVPPSYVLQPGDQVFVGLTGSIDGTVDARIDTNGRIFLPRVGAVRVGGVAYADLKTTIERAVGRQYREFRVTVSVPRLRGTRVYVTGFANNPGAYTVSSLSTLVNAVLAAGGPAAGGSFRSIKLYRNGALVSDFDLYDLVRGGDRSKDAVLQNEDVLFIPAVGAQVAVTGSVNAEAIYEAKPGESLETLLRYAGGTTVLADTSRVILYRVSNLDAGGGREVSRAEMASAPAEGGDLVQVLSTGTLVRPLERQAVVVRVDGEVNKPGNYYVPPNTTIDQVMALAGGTTSRAFIFGTNLQRLSVRQQQRVSFLEAIQQLEVSLAAAPLTGDSSVDPVTRAQQVASATAVLERLRRAEPDGRVVMDLQPQTTALPGTLALENSDRIFIPPRPTTVGVFGAVYRPASFLIAGAAPMRVRDYLAKAGGALRSADKSEVFVVRANGEVLSRRGGALRAVVVPGDVIFVPVRTARTSVLTRILQFSTIAFQLGISAAALAAINN